MAEVRFKKGDVVKLKSGSPYLCVEDPASEASSLVDVVWFEGSLVYRERFDESLLDSPSETY
jgi:uncharacterized protein YodC (DUF2158 family)